MLMLVPMNMPDNDEPDNMMQTVLFMLLLQVERLEKIAEGWRRGKWDKWVKGKDKEKKGRAGSTSHPQHGEDRVVVEGLLINDDTKHNRRTLR